MLPGYVKFLLLSLLIHNQAFSQKPIDKNEIITIGGIKQYILIKGKDDSKPLILFLHGGPGGSLLNKTDQISRKLQDHFVVVQWDQRETGETFRLNKSPKPLTLDLFYNDTHDLIDTLLKRFKQPKLYLVGYSWGTGMGFHIAGKYPELLYAYIAVSPVIDQLRSDSISLMILRKTMGKKAREELQQVKIPFENAEQLYYHRKWLYKHEGQKFVGLALKKSYVESWAATWFDVWMKSCEINLFESLPTINCPVYFFAGDKDFNTNYSVTRDYFRMVTAPKKEFFLINDAGHALLESDADSFQEIVISRILPQTVGKTN